LDQDSGNSDSETDDPAVTGKPTESDKDTNEDTILNLGWRNTNCVGK